MIERRIFERKRFIVEQLLQYGFNKKENKYLYETDLMDGAFYAVIVISEEGHVEGKVVDAISEEEYAQLHMEDFNGAYVGQIRKEYEKLLREVADICCTNVLFVSNQANRLSKLILKKYDIYPDFPWRQSQYKDYGVFRHKDSEKWFAVIMNIKWDLLLKNKDEDKVDVINLKINAQDSELLMVTKGIYHGYHMNHRNWISVVLNDTLDDNEIMKLIENSFSLT
ncbi:MAG: MmcQ/YjbR family DNA-binding protein [Eubacteriales bacterium]|nr:MmcQ/YjbR family DNA-binding protein [Eubacteriales bacterium]MDY3333214.1 MmcQ/YjbR family DNA-binding protein [Gallibacter sp.]